jgi:hypothetical protein
MDDAVSIDVNPAAIDAQAAAKLHGINHLSE